MYHIKTHMIYDKTYIYLIKTFKCFYMKYACFIVYDMHHIYHIKTYICITHHIYTYQNIHMRVCFVLIVRIASAHLYMYIYAHLYIYIHVNIHMCRCYRVA